MKKVVNAQFEISKYQYYTEASKAGCKTVKNTLVKIVPETTIQTPQVFLLVMSVCLAGIRMLLRSLLMYELYLL